MAIINNTPTPTYVNGTTVLGTSAPPELVPKYWAKKIWETGKRKSYFSRFMGKGSSNIIQIVKDLSKNEGDNLRIPLRLPLTGAGRVGDDELVGHEEITNHSWCDVTINQIRHATKILGRFAEKITFLPLREEANAQLSDWLRDYIDYSWFSIFTGTTHPFIRTTSDKFAFPIDQPSADRIMYAGGRTAINQITPTDKFDTDLISKAKLMASVDPYKQITPINVDGHETYIMLVHPYQLRDLRADPKWIDAQQYANVRGENNPIFKGSEGIWDGVVIHKNSKVPITNDGNGGTEVGHALLLGGQAGIFAEGMAPFYETEDWDYKNKKGFSIGRMCGMKKTQFKFDGVNDTDFGVINVMTAAVA